MKPSVVLYYNFCPCLLLCCAYWGAYAPQEHKRQKAKVVIWAKPLLAMKIARDFQSL